MGRKLMILKILHITYIIFTGAQFEHRLRLGLGRKLLDFINIAVQFQHISIILFLQVPSVNQGGIMTGNLGTRFPRNL